jgi:hypothetical protein
MDANATCPVARPGTGTIRTSGLRELAQAARPDSAGDSLPLTAESHTPASRHHTARLQPADLAS